MKDGGTVRKNYEDGKKKKLFGTKLITKNITKNTRETRQTQDGATGSINSHLNNNFRFIYFVGSL